MDYLSFGAGHGRVSAGRGGAVVLAAVLGFLHPAAGAGSNEWTIVEGDEWMRTTFGPSVVAGSPLDFSRFAAASAPAGKDGMWGTAANLPRLKGSNFSYESMMLPKPVTDAAVVDYVRRGFNVVRAHWFDGVLLKEGGSSAELDPERLDRFDYFVAKMKEAGVYFTYDCYVCRAFSAKDDGLGAYVGKRAMKELCLVSPAARANWKKYVRNLVTHVNPYTGLSLADDPAVMCVNLVNEDSCEKLGRPGAPGDELYAAALAEWSAARGYTNVVRNIEKDRRYLEFLTDLQAKCLDEMIRFVKDELGVKSPVTSLNFCTGPTFAVRRAPFDVTDAHAYFNHPPGNAYGSEAFATKGVFSNPLKGAEACKLVRELSRERSWDMPFVVTEHKHCWPSVYRAQVGPMMGAYAAFQGWDALMEYGYAGRSGDFGTRRQVSFFVTMADPVAMFAEVISNILFLRGDVAPARRRVGVAVDRNMLRNPKSPIWWPGDFGRLAFVSAIGSTLGDGKGLSDVRPLADIGQLFADPAFVRAKASGVYTNDTGEIVLDTNAGALSVVTPRSEAFAFERGELRGRALAASAPSVPSVVSLHSLDDRPLDASARMLLFHLTDAANEGERYDGPERRTMLSKGKNGRVLVRKGSVRVSFARAVRVFALCCDGTRAGELASEDGRTFRLATDAFPQGILAYEVVPKKGTL